MMTTDFEKGSKDFEELRHRAAYVHTTGWLPTHLRDHMRALLAKVTRYSKTPSALDGGSGSVLIPKTRAKQLGLDEHPMVAKAREYVADGWHIQARRGPKARRPYGKVFLVRTTPDGKTEYATVQSDGSVLDHW